MREILLAAGYALAVAAGYNGIDIVTKRRYSNHFWKVKTDFFRKSIVCKQNCGTGWRWPGSVYPTFKEQLDPNPTVEQNPGPDLT